RVLFSADLDAEKAARLELGEELLVLALPMRDEAREDTHLGALAERRHLARDLACAPRLHGFAAGHAALFAGSRVEDGDVVVDVRDRADGRAWVRGGALLLDRDRRRQTADPVDVRTLELSEELPRVGRERLEVAALAFGIEGV